MKSLKGQRCISGEFTSVLNMLSIIFQIVPSQLRHAGKVWFPSSQLLYILTAWGNRGDQSKPCWSKNARLLKRPHNLWEYCHFHSSCIWSLWCLILLELLCRWLEACYADQKSQFFVILWPLSCWLHCDGIHICILGDVNHNLRLYIYSVPWRWNLKEQEERTLCNQISPACIHVSGVFALLCDDEKTLHRIPSAMRSISSKVLALSLYCQKHFKMHE